METAQTTHTVQLDLAYDQELDLATALADAVAYYRHAAPSLTVALVAEEGPSGWPLVEFTCASAAELEALVEAYDGE